jgi:hypothetical protein
MTNGIRIEDIEELLGLFHRLEELLTPNLPVKNTQLWEQALQQAKEELDEQLRKRQAGFTFEPGRNLPSRKASKAESQKAQKGYEERIRQIAEGNYCKKDPAYAKAVEQAKSEALDILKRIDHLLLAVRGPLLQFPRAKTSLLAADWKKDIRDCYGSWDKNSFSYKLREAIDVSESLKLQIERQQPLPEKPPETEQENQVTEGGREGTIAPEPPKILQNIIWVWKYGRKHWKLLLIAGLVLFIPTLLKFNPFRDGHRNISSEAKPNDAFESGQPLRKSAGTCEVTDMVRLFVDGLQGWGRWDTGAQPGTPITWITEDKYDDPPEDMGTTYGVFARHGKVVLTIKGKPVYQQLKRTIEPGIWEIWLVGPNAGVVIVKIESENGSDLPFDVSEVLSKAGFNVTLYKGLKERNTTGNFILYHIESPGGGKAWLAESWGIGTAGGAQEIWITYQQQYADILWEKEGSLGKQHLLWGRESNEASRPNQ